MTWLFAILGIASLIVIHEAGHAFAAKRCGMKVERFALFFPPIIGRWRKGETEYAIGSIPLGGYVRIVGQNPSEEIAPEDVDRAYGSKPIWQRMVVIAAGPFANIVSAVLLITALLMFHGVATVTPVIGGGELSAPSRGVLTAGDRIVSIDGVSGSPQRLVRQTRTHRCAGKVVSGCVAATPATVRFERAGKSGTALLKPRWDGAARAMRLGFSFSINYRRMGPFEALSKSVGVAWRVSVGAVKGFLSIATPEGRRQVSGIVGVSVVTEKAFSQDVAWALELLAFVSLLIAIVNLVPLLPLDGGHLFWLAVEKVRGRPVSQAVLGNATAVGMVLVLGLFLIGLSNDIFRLGGAGFDTVGR